MRELRDQIRSAREAAGLTQEEAAEVAGVTAQSWRYFEWNGKRVPSRFGAMCEAVGLDPVKVLREGGVI